MIAALRAAQTRRPAAAELAPVTEVVHAALERKGLHRAAQPREAEIRIDVDFHVGPQRAYVAPDDQRRRARTAVPPERGQYQAVWQPDGTISDQSGAPASSRNSRELGAVEVVRGYGKHLTIVVRTNTHAGEAALARGVELWRLEVSREDAHPEFGAGLPALITAAVEQVPAGTTPPERTELYVEAAGVVPQK